MTITATRFHDISCGHRVVGHESKCAFLHGHNYRIHFTCQAMLDAIGRVIDFSVMKKLLCFWLEENWDHRFLAWEQDPVLNKLLEIRDGQTPDDRVVLTKSILWVPFNPTAENMAMYLLTVIGPQQLKDTGVVLTKVTVEETRKCSASVALPTKQF